VKVLVTGATGYIGGRLIPKLLDAGHSVRVLVRDPTRIGQRSWIKRVSVMCGDLLQPAGLSQVFAGIDAAYYLVHSMEAGPDFAEHDRRAAQNFATAASRVKHTIYLGGLVPDTNHVSEHLASRVEVGEILRKHLPVTELRAGPIIGSGSASFELMRYLIDRLPVVLSPRWLNHMIQPIAVRDVLSYLCAVLDREPLGVLEVGTDRLSFKRMMLEIAETNKLKRWFLPSPLPTPKQAAYAAGMITPLPRHLATPLVMGVVHPVLADTDRVTELFPGIKPIPYERAIALAMGKVHRSEVETSWSGALGEGPTFRLSDWEGILQEERSMFIPAPLESVFHSFVSVGGDRGWPAWNWAWQLRGALDKLVGGPGLRRGRRHPVEVLPGETIDFWRVEAVTAPRLLRLRAEMRVPGKAWLQWATFPEAGGTRLVQKALFAPRGTFGALYWYALYPFHKPIFSQMIEAIAADSIRHAANGPDQGTPGT